MSLGAICLALAACGSTPTGLITEDRVDLVEVNHLYDEQGRRLFDQVIFYDWSADQRRFNVRAWRLVKSPSQLPLKHVSGGFVSIWHDDRTLRRVVAKSKRESWTQYDPELIDRQFLPKDKRPNLTKRIHTDRLRR